MHILELVLEGVGFAEAAAVIDITFKDVSRLRADKIDRHWRERTRLRGSYYLRFAG